MDEDKYYVEVERIVSAIAQIYQEHEGEPSPDPVTAPSDHTGIGARDLQLPAQAEAESPQ